MILQTRNEKQVSNCLTNPEKVGKILYLFCLGVSQSQMVKNYGVAKSIGIRFKNTLTILANG